MRKVYANLIFSTCQLKTQLQTANANINQGFKSRIILLLIGIDTNVPTFSYFTSLIPSKFYKSYTSSTFQNTNYCLFVSFMLLFKLNIHQYSMIHRTNKVLTASSIVARQPCIDDTPYRRLSFSPSSENFSVLGVLRYTPISFCNHTK